ncbi:TetR/AcrR family transcriptional regulator [Pseudoglutamicibacter albus]|uniref:HTH tetR-type domain-containing protein n=1 Tax=Pseudoglutamicibacter albus DNF00011 TaxID=1401063 RepID=A0A095YD76_9MICC|nr:helix-turn-helix domain-containing protein [Pseudoglutamicibacter albus]KGF20193.1 hypothetical protein HMPREF2128_06620 [Pseudoglutamicibacter albus DNF00011]
MARPREFDTAALLQQAGELFIRRGFTATSIDEVVKTTGVVRGSLYSIFGSKQGIFVAALKHAADEHSDGDGSDHGALLDLLNVAVFEIAPHNRDVAELVQRIIDTNGITAQALGQRALQRACLTAATG